MLALKSRTQAAIGGFQFIDAPISGDVIQDWSFQNIVQTVINRRLQNPRFNLPTDVVTVSSEVDLQNAQRMRTIKGGDYYVQDTGGGNLPSVPFPPAHRSGLQVVQAVGSRSIDIKDGAEILLEWLGAGGQPVDAALATKRAEVCSTCPQNGSGDWTTYFTAPAASIIRRQLGQKAGLKLTTPLDDSLGVCKACSCPLKLKVHVPLAHITAHTRPEVLTRLDPRCWMLLEK
jgi:hypothetical protein